MNVVLSISGDSFMYPRWPWPHDYVAEARFRFLSSSSCSSSSSFSSLSLFSSSQGAEVLTEALDPGIRNRGCNNITNNSHLKKGLLWLAVHHGKGSMVADTWSSWSPWSTDSKWRLVTDERLFSLLGQSGWVFPAQLNSMTPHRHSQRPRRSRWS